MSRRPQRKPGSENSWKNATSSSSVSQSWAAPQLQPKIQSKKPSNSVAFAPASVLARAAGRGAGRSGGRGPVSGRGTASQNPSAADVVTGTAADGITSQAMSAGHMVSTSSIFSMSGHIKEEYDPMRPNEYEQVLKERERRKKEADAEAQRQAKLKELDAVVARLTSQDGGAEAGSEEDQLQRRDQTLGISGEEAFLRRGKLSSGRGGSDVDEAPKGMTLAQKMLEKMGWKEGDGLGKNKQGMQTPLVAQKTDKHAAVIVNAEPSMPSSRNSGGGLKGLNSRVSSDLGEPPEKRAHVMPGATLVGKPARVICLRNMVGPGEVDEDLEDEVGNELTKYGNVTSVMIFEVTTPGYSPEEAVRIFIQFDRIESATKAQIDLQGRFFGGRSVRVAFFDEGRFERTELAPAAGEFE
ncbi:hypothetical protein CEUSTIGMA_g920.t1 [Chlamydomonas eustigma]|uniref:G-patch domain-containing protein n=1 Tax=Chlamydomonas eustigma TaxID=1157962 RepID=A0A250WRL3_9CHLO|nr:hypothetical protein CEUSTIGMA_g920.t1 [Chlamydomonas eustigma]|eukprot:GAX73468.1 hypothetical protein CEUSTIGMA_g920.t1 [Chlamydomonas eustigma]